MADAVEDNHLRCRINCLSGNQPFMVALPFLDPFKTSQIHIGWEDYVQRDDDFDRARDVRSSASPNELGSTGYPLPIGAECALRADSFRSRTRRMRQIAEVGGTRQFTGADVHVCPAQVMLQPPSTVIDCPVMKEASGEARNATRAAISDGSPRRFIA